MRKKFTVLPVFWDRPSLLHTGHCTVIWTKTTIWFITNYSPAGEDVCTHGWGRRVEPCVIPRTRFPRDGQGRGSVVVYIYFTRFPRGGQGRGSVVVDIYFLRSSDSAIFRHPWWLGLGLLSPNWLLWGGRYWVWGRGILLIIIPDLLSAFVLLLVAHLGF